MPRRDRHLRIVEGHGGAHLVELHVRGVGLQRTWTAARKLPPTDGGSKPIQFSPSTRMDAALQSFSVPTTTRPSSGWISTTYMGTPATPYRGAARS